jgi:hypothetical protein
MYYSLGKIEIHILMKQINKKTLFCHIRSLLLQWENLAIIVEIWSTDLFFYIICIFIRELYVFPWFFGEAFLFQFTWTLKCNYYKKLSLGGQCLLLLFKYNVLYSNLIQIYYYDTFLESYELLYQE